MTPRQQELLRRFSINAEAALMDAMATCSPHAVAPVVGLARIAAAAPGLALALGYDVEQALE